MIDITVVLTENRLGIHALQNTNKLGKFKVHEVLSKLYFLPPYYLVGTSLKKPLLYVWNLSQDSSVQKYVLPGLALCIAASPCGQYLAAGCDNNIKFWHLPTGQLVNTVSNHYQKVTCLKWSHDGRNVISGGHDNTVNVWDFSKIISEPSTSTTLYTFTNHSMPVSDIYCGYGGFKSRLFTSGLDNTCNIYEMSTGKLIVTLEFPAPIARILVNKTESCVYAVSVSTDVYRVSLMSPPDNDVSKQMKIFIKCANKISSCCLTDDDASILLGTSNGDVFKYSANSGQILPYTFKNTSADDLINITLPTYKRNDKPQQFPFQLPLQRTVTGVMDNCTISLNQALETTIISDCDFLSLVKEAVAEDQGDNVAELRAQAGELGGLSEQLIKFATEKLIGS